jgi:hypothetical protein
VPNMALQRTHRPRFLKVRFGSSNGHSVQEHAGTGRSLRSLGAPLNAQLLGRRRQLVPSHQQPKLPRICRGEISARARHGSQE